MSIVARAMTEELIPIHGYPAYAVTRNGQVFSYKAGVFLTPVRIGSKGKDPYHGVSLYCHGKKKTHKVHRLVAEAFIPNPLGKPQINHKDGDKINNNASNLEWADNAENMAHAATSQLLPIRKLTREKVLSIRRGLENGETCIALAKVFGVSAGHISDIKDRSRWGHI